MKNDMKKRILSAQLALILLMMLWCGTYFETKESQRQMEQLEASQLLNPVFPQPKKRSSIVNHRIRKCI